MKNIIILFLIFLSIGLMAQNVYYVRADGDDSNTGLDTTTVTAWATWQKAFDVADEGDTVYFMDRGGVYYLGTDEYVVLDPDNSHGNNGTYSAPICFFNYPGESPILDAIGHTNITDATAFDVRNATYIKFRGLIIQNEKEDVIDQWIASMQFYDNGN